MPTWTTPTAIHSKCGETAPNIATRTIDDDTNTYWNHDAACYHGVIFDMGQSYTISKIRLFQDSSLTVRWGLHVGLDVFVGDDPANLGSAVWTGALNASGWQESGAFSKSGRYVKLVSKSFAADQILKEFDAYCESVAAGHPTKARWHGIPGMNYTGRRGGW